MKITILWHLVGLDAVSLHIDPILRHFSKNTQLSLVRTPSINIVPFYHIFDHKIGGRPSAINTCFPFFPSVFQQHVPAGTLRHCHGYNVDDVGTQTNAQQTVYCGRGNEPDGACGKPERQESCRFHRRAAGLLAGDPWLYWSRFSSGTLHLSSLTRLCSL